jgi:Ca2+/Na+ antiporter
VNGLEAVLELINKNTGALSVIINLLLVIITAVYVYLTGSLSKTSNKTIEHTYNEYSEKLNKEESIKKNLIYLLNSEIYMNSFIYVLSQYYLQNGNQIKLGERLRLFLKTGGVSFDLASKGHIVTHTKLSTWKEINSQCAQYFPNALMQELTGYYTGVEHSKIFSVTGMSNDSFIEVCKGQLISTYKCLELLKDEELDLRTNEEFHIDDKILVVNKSTGTLVEKGKLLKNVSHS